MIAEHNKGEETKLYSASLQGCEAEWQRNIF
jgi:hypothetical protein